MTIKKRIALFIVSSLLMVTVLHFLAKYSLFDAAFIGVGTGILTYLLPGLNSKFKSDNHS